MPETNTRFSGATPISGSTFFICARIEKSPQPGHQRISWLDAKSLAVNFRRCDCTMSSEFGWISPSISSMTPVTSFTQNGRPRILPSDTTSTR